MAKTRFTESARNEVQAWMMSKYDEKHTGKELQKLQEKMVAAINVAIRKKYPEADMVVLRKYNCSRVDACLKFVDSESNQFFGIDFQVAWNNKEKNPFGLADIPDQGNCNNSGVISISPKGRELTEAFIKMREEVQAARRKKETDYRSFLSACRYVEDAHEVIAFSEEMQRKLFSGGSLIAINPEIVASIKQEFAA